MTEPTLYPESGFLRLRIDLAYDGTNFSGWAIQPDRRTVQGEIEKAIKQISQTPIETIVAGRTDAGVHATGQVIHVDLPDTFNFENLTYKLNRILDTDLRVLKVGLASSGFHARFSAIRRHYNYKILDANQVVLPVHRFDVVPYYRQLDVATLNQASALLLGRHDFVAYSKFREGATTVRELQRFEWHKDEHGYLVADISANAFCYSMVRHLVGAVVCVAEGRFPREWVTERLNNKLRISESLVFPAQGLTLCHVDYPSQDEIALQSQLDLASLDLEEDN
jgi:tRNA pseudouridine38-40 synthase